MGKISQVSSKYTVSATIEIDGIVERPDVIGAIFGQTEGLLGNDLELRELQRSGRIGRIEVDLETKEGKTKGTITIPSSLDKTETSMVGAALEVIERIGPCDAHVEVKGIEDVRTNKRSYVMDRAKQLLKGMVDESPATDMKGDISSSVKAKDVKSIGPEKLACGPEVEESNEIIIVEGRADVIVLLKNGIKNAVAMNGTSVPDTIKELCEEKEVTVFTDGDRGGDLIIRELLTVASIDYVTKAPDGKEVEELVSKEIHQALRKKVPAAKAKREYLKDRGSLRKRSLSSERGERRERSDRPERGDRRSRGDRDRGDRRSRGGDRYERRAPRPLRLPDHVKEALADNLKTVKGKKAAVILDREMNIMGKVPVKDLPATLESLRGTDAHTVVVDGKLSEKIVAAADEGRLKQLVVKENKDEFDTRVKIITSENLK